MRFETRFIVVGEPKAVIAQFGDVPLMASFLPGASVDVASADGSYPATLVASFGPKRIAFKGTLTNSVDLEALSGLLRGQASADVRGAKMGVTMHYHLSPLVDGPGAAKKTEVHLESEAQLTGILAEFAKAGGVIVAEALIAEFARRFSTHMQAASTGEAYVAPEGGASLSMTTVMAALLRRLKGWLVGA